MLLQMIVADGDVPYIYIYDRLWDQGLQLSLLHAT